MEAPQDEKKAILILGAGFGGIRAALELEKKFRHHPELFEEYEIVLIDQHGYHLFTPVLYEIATTPEKSAQNRELARIATFPLKTVIGKRCIRFLQKKITGLDVRTKTVFFYDGSKMTGEYVLIALGSETNFFNIPGAKEHAMPFKSLYDILHVRHAVETLLESREKHSCAIVIGGGGATGIEFSAELASWIRRHKRSSVRSGECSITVVEAAPDILPGIDRRIVRTVKKRLDALGIRIVVGEPIQEVNRAAVRTAKGREFPYDVFVWSAGTRANHLLFEQPIRQETRGRVEVSGIMECVSPDPHFDFGGKLYAIGDAVCLYEPKTGGPFPSVAPAAIDQGRIAAANIYADITGGKKIEYTPREYPYALPIGGKWAAVKIGPIVIIGILGWIGKGLAEFRYLTSILPLRKALKVFVKGFFIFIRND